MWRNLQDAAFQAIKIAELEGPASATVTALGMAAMLSVPSC
jgi:hypothetical protein